MKKNLKKKFEKKKFKKIFEKNILKFFYYSFSIFECLASGKANVWFPDSPDL